MKKFLGFLNSPPMLLLLVFSGTLFDLFLLGRHYDLSKEQWAGWVQAVGSIAALAVAMFIMWWQGRRDARAARTREIERQMNLVVAINHCAIRLKTNLGVIKATLDTTEIPNTHDMEMHHATLNSILGAIDRIPMWEVSGPIALDLGAISTICSTVTALLDRNRSNHGNWARLQLFSQIQTFHDMAAAKEVAFTAEFERIYNELARRS